MRNDLHRRTRRAEALFHQKKIAVHFDEKAKQKIFKENKEKENK
jgi:hypothetical protein